MRKHILLFSLVISLVLPSSFVSARTSSDPLLQEQWYLDQINVQDAWDTTVGGAVVVAVIDTGMDITHQDLADNIYINPGEIALDGIDNDGNGFIDDVHGWDFLHDDSEPSTAHLASSDVVGAHHATVVAGVIGAIGNNAQGVAGVSWDVKILPVQAMAAEGNGSTTDIIKGIDYAVAMGADVINLSFVGDQNSPGLNAALQRAYDAGVIIVAAMGNGDKDLDADPLYPVCSLGTGNDNVVIGVAATTIEDKRASFSNYGKTCADIAAPGINIYTTQVEILGETYGGGWNGTSLAAPIVSGAAALALSVYPNMTPDEMRIGLQLSVDPLQDLAPSGTAGALGTGRVNIGKLFDVLPSIVKDQTARVSAPEQTEVEESADDSSTVIKLYDRPLAVGAAPGERPYVALDKGEDDAEWLAYGEGFLGGVDVAVGQLDAAAGYEIVTVPGAGGGRHVRVFSDTGVLMSEFFAYSASMTDGLQVTTGDVDGDGVEEIIVAAGGADSQVRLFTLAGELLGVVDIQDVVSDLRIASSDVDGDGRDELVLAQGPGSEPYVSIYEFDGKRVGSFAAYGLNMDRGVYVTTVPYGGRDVIVTGTGNGAGPQVRIFSNIGALVGQFFAFAKTDRDGVRVAGWRPSEEGIAHIVTSGLINGIAALRLHGVDGTLVDTSPDMSPFKDRVTIGAGT